MLEKQSFFNRYPECVAVFALVAIDVLWGSRSNLEFRRFWLLAPPVILLLCIWIFYAKYRRKDRLADLAYFVVMPFMSGIAGVVASYLVSTHALPLRDQEFVDLDSRMGFHWMDWITFFRAHPLFTKILQAAYDSWPIQLYGSAFYFALTGQKERNQDLLRLALLASFFTLILYYKFPALGPFFHFAVAPNLEYLLHVPLLRANAPMPLTPMDLQGIICFPSYHAVTAVMFVYVYRGQGKVFWMFLALNSVMLLSTLISGGHYLIDVIGGLAVVAISILVIRLRRSSKAQRTAGQSTSGGAPARPL